MRKYQFKSFQDRLTFFIISLLVFSLTATLITINTVSIDNTKDEIIDSLHISSDVFKNQLQQNQEKLFEIARLLSSDYAFKTAYSTHDHDTILSAMENHLARISGKNMMLLMSLKGKIIAHTLMPGLKGQQNPWPKLQHEATLNDYGEATSLVIINKLPYQVMVVPLLTPVLDAWIYIGFPLDEKLLNRIKSITRTEITIVNNLNDNSSNISGSTLSSDNAGYLYKNIANNITLHNDSSVLNLAGIQYVSLPIQLPSVEGITITAILQRSLDDALKPYYKLRNILFLIFTISLATSIILAFIIARQVTQPVKQLTFGAEEIKNGNYEQTINIKLKDEIGTLANSFNNMARGLKEKEKVRNLLGKVVSPAIAEELLSKDIKLGGEEKQVTTLFCDVRNFTTLCEGRKPEEILTLLNEYFTQISTKIEENGGVVDKYIGDAVMAIFGAPIQHHDDALRAVKSAFAMCQSLKQLNSDFKQRGIAPLGIGIGINSDRVVAGNMGSINRLNYTVIGDGVNLASRLEGLTKNYGVDIIVSQSTAHAAPDFLYRELDIVKVKGKNTACIIYEPVGLINYISADITKSVDYYTQALNFYRQMKWDKAKAIFHDLLNASPQSRLYQLYINRCEIMKENPPEENWDGSFIYTNK